MTINWTKVVALLVFCTSWKDHYSNIMLHYKSYQSEIHKFLFINNTNLNHVINDCLPCVIRFTLVSNLGFSGEGGSISQGWQIVKNKLPI